MQVVTGRIVARHPAGSAASPLRGGRRHQPGTIASSTAWTGFGLDSVIEVPFAAAVAWQFSARDHALRAAREKTTPA
ncbi:hypothetical protein ABZ027_04565 [Streptomyces sp. NPDC006332]|uniref:hypothetical protein n=1 Tax=Streptomyces sp. NPDC006332 TaxID=3155456 RepID=UPI0033B63647